MRLFCNLPRRVNKIKLTFIEEEEGTVKQEKTYSFTRDQLAIWDSDYKMNAFINQCIAPDWPNKDKVRRRKKYDSPEPETVKTSETSEEA